MTYHTLFGILAAILGVFSFFPYLASILKGETKPHRTTYGIWSIIGGVELVSYFASGARITALLPAIYLFGELVVFVLSLKRGMGGTKKLDIFCLAGATIGVIGWALTKDPHVALYLSILASTCGFIPTVKKTYLLPHTESRLSWSVATVAALCNVFAVSRLELYLVIYPLYTLAFDGAEAALTVWPRVLRRPRRQKAAPQS